MNTNVEQACIVSQIDKPDRHVRITQSVKSLAADLEERTRWELSKCEGEGHRFDRNVLARVYIFRLRVILIHFRADNY